MTQFRCITAIDVIADAHLRPELFHDALARVDGEERAVHATL